MKTILRSISVLFLVTISGLCYGQDEIKTLIGGNAIQHSGGYGALTNKFTNIGGHYANLSGVYGGWYINHKFMLGVAGAALTNNIPVPDVYSTLPGEKMSFEYGQCGLMTEYVIGSNRAIHASFQLFSGAGFTTQYNRDQWKNNDNDIKSDNAHDTNWFVVTEPGVNIEMNIFKWMRFCPGVSYRAAFGSNAAGLKDKDINGITLNLGLKFGKF